MYDVALSFAGEDRKYVRGVADALIAAGVEVFYDEYEQVDLWGKNLFEHLTSIYRDESRYVVIFASRHYSTKVWTSHERRSAQARAIAEQSECILPVRFDDTQIPGLLNTTSYIDLTKLSPGELADLISKKIKSADYWIAQLAEASDFCTRVLHEAHRGAFLWRKDATVVFDNRVADSDEPYLVSLRSHLTKMPLLAQTSPKDHPILLLLNTSDAHSIHESVWGAYHELYRSSHSEFQKEIADRITGTIRFSPVRGPT